MQFKFGHGVLSANLTTLCNEHCPAQVCPVDEQNIVLFFLWVVFVLLCIVLGLIASKALEARAEHARFQTEQEQLRKQSQIRRQQWTKHYNAGARHLVASATEIELAVIVKQATERLERMMRERLGLDDPMKTTEKEELDRYVDVEKITLGEEEPSWEHVD